MIMLEREVLKQTAKVFFDKKDFNEFVDVLETYHSVPHLRIVAEEMGKVSMQDVEKGFFLLTSLSVNEKDVARETSALCLGEMSKLVKWEKIAPFLERLANDSKWEIREAAASGTKKALSINFDEVFPTLLVWSKSPQKNLRRAAVIAVMQGNLKEEEKVYRILNLLEHLLSDRTLYVRRNLGPFALGYLGYRYPRIVLPKLSSWTKSENEVTRWNVAMVFSQALGYIFPKQGLAVLKKLANDERRFVWRSVVSSLVNINKNFPDLVIPEVQGWLTNDELKKTAEAFFDIISRHKK